MTFVQLQIEIATIKQNITQFQASLKRYSACYLSYEIQEAALSKKLVPRYSMYCKQGNTYEYECGGSNQ